MRKKLVSLLLMPIIMYFSKIPEFIRVLSRYLKARLFDFYVFFENNKNILVRFFMMKRGRYNRPFLHFAALIVLTLGVISAPFLASTYPVFSQNSTSSQIASPQTNQSVIVGENVFSTHISQKPRDKIVIYTVAKGDTLSTIAEKFGVSASTIRWQNNLTSDTLNIGDALEILPVTGVAHKVIRGETVYTIAKRYDTNPQKIVDFPFNDFANPETFSLVTGQFLIVPDGIKPSEQPKYVRPRQVFVQGPTSVSSAGFAWPLRGGFSQYFSWYHPGIDITNDVGTPIVAATDGVVTSVSSGTWDGGYGNNVYIDMGDGHKTHYAHMSAIYVSSGQSVVAGKTIIGTVGSTGRSTGPHLHFEIIQSGVLVNPLPFLQ